MAKFITILLIGAAISGCQKKQEVAALKPSEVVVRTWEAVNAHDTGAYLKLVCESRRKAYHEHPESLVKSLDYWKTNRFDVQVLSETEDASVATVTYHLKATGDRPHDTTQSVQLYKENGEWKFGY